MSETPDRGCDDHERPMEVNRQTETTTETMRQRLDDTDVDNDDESTDEDTSPSVTVDIDWGEPTPMDESDGERYRQWATMMEELLETLIAKDMDYDNSFVAAAEERASSPVGYNDSKMELFSTLDMQTQHKRNRHRNLVFESDGNVDESPAQTAMDAVGYWFFTWWTHLHYEEQKTHMEVLTDYRKRLDEETYVGSESEPFGVVD